MAVIVNQNSNTYAIPEEGQYLGVVADVIDLGPVTTQFGTKEKVQIVWLLDAYDEEGNQFRVSAFYNKSLHEKASLTRDIKKIAGVTPSGQFDVESLLGLNSSLVIEHNESDGKTYANITAILKAPKGKVLGIPDDFERKIDRDGTGSSENPVNTVAKPKPGRTAPQAARPAAPVPAAAQNRTGGGSTITRRPAAAVAAQEPQETEIDSSDIPF